MLRRLIVVAIGLGVFALVVTLGVTLFARQLRGDPKALMTEANALLDAGNATTARDRALAAVRAAPEDAEAHLLLARAQLALDDGLGADAEIQRAIDAGYNPRLVAHLRAQALLLQGDADKALAALGKTDPKFQPDALRIRARAQTAKGDYAAALAAIDQAARLAPLDAVVWTDMGRFKMTVGDLLGAIQASERAVKLAPGNVDALVLRGELVRTQYGLVAALPWFEAALKRDPADHDALIEYASTLGDAGRTVDSLAVTRRALAARPGSAQALYLQAVIAARAGDSDLARTLLAKTGGTLGGMPGVQLLSASLDIEAGDYQQAIGKLGPLVGDQPMNLTARKLLALALLRTDAARNAIDMLRPVVARSDADAYALTLSARGYERIGDRANAAKLLDRAAYPAIGAAASFSADDGVAVLAADAAQRPGDPNAIVPLIRSLIDSGDKGAALAKAQETAARNRGAPAAHLLLGDALMLNGRAGDAVAAYRRAADLRFDEPAMLRLVDALSRTSQREAAANTLALFLSQNPVNAPALRLWARWQIAAGDFDAAIDTLELLRSRIGDGDAGLNADLANAYTGAGEIEAAQDLGEAAYALAPANPAVADAFGWALYKGGDLNGATELLQKAVALAPRHAGLRWHLAQVYADLNRKGEAKAEAQAALADPGFTDRGAAQALIAS